MDLPQVSPKNSYRTGRDDMVKEFHVPFLQESVPYRHWAGYFSGHGLALAATINNPTGKPPCWDYGCATQVAATIRCTELLPNRSDLFCINRPNNSAN